MACGSEQSETPATSTSQHHRPPSLRRQPQVQLCRVRRTAALCGHRALGSTPQAVRVLDAAGFEVVIVEAVGVGQAEVEVAGLAMRKRSCDIQSRGLML